METKLTRKRRLRRLRREEIRLRKQMHRLYDDLCFEIAATMPRDYIVYWSDETQGIVVKDTSYLTRLAEAQYRNASHWLNDHALWRRR